MLHKGTSAGPLRPFRDTVQRPRGAPQRGPGRWEGRGGSWLRAAADRAPVQPGECGLLLGLDHHRAPVGLLGLLVGDLPLEKASVADDGARGRRHDLSGAESRVRKGEVSRNVAKLADAPTPGEREQAIWTPEQTVQFLELTKAERLYPLYLTAMATEESWRG